MKVRRRHRVVFAGIALAAIALAVSPAPGPTPATLDALFPSGRLTISFDRLAAKYPLAAGKDFQVDEVGRDAHSGHHTVWIVDREVPHRHDTHDLFVVVVRGYGTMRLGAETRPVGEGSILYVPRGTPHAFANESGKPALAYAVYFPAFDGKDRVTVD
jgi:mannose-6-phosphate isomerase-like protein (cupin superfamily)